MNSEDFASAVRKAVLEKGLERYQDHLKNIKRSDVKDPTWRVIFQGWDSLDDQQRESVLQFVRLAMVDTISNLFSVLDNVSVLNNYREYFVCTYGPDKEKVSGDLQDYFLAAEEEEPPKTLWKSS